MLKCMLDDVAPQSGWTDRLFGLLDDYADLTRERMGFPDDCCECPIWKKTPHLRESLPIIPLENRLTGNPRNGATLTEAASDIGSESSAWSISTSTKSGARSGLPATLADAPVDGLDQAEEDESANE